MSTTKPAATNRAKKPMDVKKLLEPDNALAVCVEGVKSTDVLVASIEPTELLVESTALDRGTVVESTGADAIELAESVESVDS